MPQPGTDNKLDSLADRLMYRLAYRNFGSHESLVVNHSVAVNGGGGVRWYEIQSPGGNPVVAQQGTYAPDSNYRWMGSVAMDKIGDIAARLQRFQRRGLSLDRLRRTRALRSAPARWKPRPTSWPAAARRLGTSLAGATTAP